MTCGIYMIQNLVNGKIYIGQALDIEDRWVRHKRELRGNYHGNKHLQHAWNSDKEDNFEFTIIYECDESQLNVMEEYYIFELMAYDDRVGYNKTYGGWSGRPTKETKKKLSEAKKGEKNNMYGKHHSEETKKKMSESQKIAMNRPEVKKKMSGVQNPMYGRIGKNNPNYGRHHTEETKKKMSESQKIAMNRPEVKKKMSESRKGENSPWYGKLGVKHPRSIPIVQLTLDGQLVELYDSSIEAKKSGFNNSKISECCRGKRKTHKGYKWMYLSDYEAMKKEG